MTERFKRAVLTALGPAAPYAVRLRRAVFRGSAEAPAPQDRVMAWIGAFRAGAAGGAPRETEALDRLCGLLAMNPGAAKGATKVAETCARIDPVRLERASRTFPAGRAPLQVRANLMTVSRRLRDAKRYDLAHLFADILERAGGGAHADRERMLIHLQAGEAARALELCEALCEDGHGGLIRPAGEWMLVRIARAPHAEGAAALAALLLSRGLIPDRVVEQAAGLADLISALAAVRERGEREGADEDEARAADAASQALSTIEAGMRGVESAGAGFELTRIRLLGVTDRFEEAFGAMVAYADEHALTPGAAAFFGQVMDRYLRWRHSEGRRMDLVAPLLDEAVFARYVDRLETEEAAIWGAWPFARNIETALNPPPPPPPQMTVPALSPTDTRLRVLVVSSNWNFVSPLIERVEGETDPGMVFRSVDFQSLTLADKAARPNGHYFFNDGAAARAWKTVSGAAPDFGRLVDWADVVMVEWANQPAVLLSRILPPGKRLVVRLHSYEAFSNWHYFIDWNRVDEAAFVAGHVRDVFLAQNRLAREAGLKTSIVANRHDFDRALPDRDDIGARTICMLGWATANKDPIFALETLRLLRAEGQDWRLRLIGGGWREQAGAFEADYRARFEAMAAESDLAPAVEYLPHTDDPLSELGRVGHVMSASHREGTHEAVIEGLAVGCAPVIRDWPMVARFGGARGQFAPFAERIARTPREAADLILAAPWTRESAEAFRERARQAYGVERAAEAFKTFVRGS